MLQEVNGQLVDQVTTTTPVDLQAKWQLVQNLHDDAVTATNNFSQALADFNVFVASYPTVVVNEVPDLAGLTGPIQLDGLDIVMPTPVDPTPVTVDPTPVTVDSAPVAPAPAA